MKKVLLVDDDPDVRYSTAKFLRFKGFDVTEAESGLVAMTLIRAQNFDVVVSDIIMPDQDGLGLLNEMRRGYPGLPVIAVSGGGRIGAVEHLKMASFLGAFAALQKPVPPDVLVETVRRAIGEAEEK